MGVTELRRKVDRRLHHTAWSLRNRVARASRHTTVGCVALTFDDGPNPDTTPRVLDVLASLDVPATFFCVGRNARAHPAVLRRALEEGHSIGSHSLTHPHPAEVDLRTLARDYRDGRRAVADVVGRDVPLFRPPHGHLGFPDAVMVRKLRGSTWLWTVDPEDWRPEATAPEITQLAGSAGSGDVILLHDWVERASSDLALRRSATIDALPLVVHRLRAGGLRFVALPDVA